MRFLLARRGLAWLAVLGAAAALRLPALPAGLPYMSYVDEGHLLHPVVMLLSRETWDPRYYTYPSLPIYAVALLALAWSPVYALLHGRPLSADLSDLPFPYYDLIAPQDLLVLGRLLALAAGLGIVWLTGRLARRLAGEEAGLAAGWLAAWIPALVIRGGIVSVDPVATFFVLAALLAAERLRDGPRPLAGAALAGALGGLAAVSKYPAAMVFLPVALAVLLAPWRWPRRLQMLGAAGLSAIVAAAVAMPALVLRTGKVFAALAGQSGIYLRDDFGVYWQQALVRAEWDLPLEAPELGLAFVVLAAGGAAAAARNPPWAQSLAGWTLFGAALGAILAPYNFRAFRNLLALVPLAVVLVALLYAAVRSRVSGPKWRRLADLAVVALPLLLWAPSLAAWERHQLTLVDSREEALSFLSARVQPADYVLFADELSFLPSRCDALDARTVGHPWPRARQAIARRRPDWLVLGNPVLPDGSAQISPADRDMVLARYAIAATFGKTTTFTETSFYRGNRQTIYVLRKKPPAEPAPPRRRSPAR